MISDGTYLTTSPHSLLSYTQERAQLHFLSFPPFVAIPELCSHLRVFKLAVSSAWNISYWLFLISQVSAKAISWEGLAKLWQLIKKVYTLLSTSICLTHSLLCIYSIACTPLCGYFYFLFPASEECKFYILSYSVLFPPDSRNLFGICVYGC